MPKIDIKNLTEDQKREIWQTYGRKVKEEKEESKEEEWEKLETGGEIFNFEKEGDEIEGTLKNIRKGQFDNGVYDIETEEGNFTVFGTTILDARLNEKHIDQPVRIVYKGWAKNKKGQKYKNFDIFIKKREGV